MVVATHVVHQPTTNDGFKRPPTPNASARREPRQLDNAQWLVWLANVMSYSYLILERERV